MFDLAYGLNSKQSDFLSPHAVDETVVAEYGVELREPRTVRGLVNVPVVGEGSALTLERRTGDSRNEVGLSPGGIVMQADLEIGSLAGDISLYLAPPPPDSGLVGSPQSETSEREVLLSIVSERVSELVAVWVKVKRGLKRKG